MMNERSKDKGVGVYVCVYISMGLERGNGRFWEFGIDRIIPAHQEKNPDEIKLC